MALKYFLEVGFFLGLLANAALFIPQAMKLYKGKIAREISPITFLGFNIIQLFTAVHAFLNDDYLLLIGNLLAFVTCGMVTVMSFMYRPARKISRELF